MSVVQHWVGGAAFGDYDNDGVLDLCNRRRSADDGRVDRNTVAEDSRPVDAVFGDPAKPSVKLVLRIRGFEWVFLGVLDRFSERPDALRLVDSEVAILWRSLFGQRGPVAYAESCGSHGKNANQFPSHYSDPSDDDKTLLSAAKTNVAPRRHEQYAASVQIRQ